MYLEAPQSGRQSAPADVRRPLSARLTLLQLSDSAFPSGRFTLSYGLEALAQAGLLRAPSEPSALVALLGDQVRLGVATSDGVALACAHRAHASGGELDVGTVVRADQRLTAVKLPREARDTSMRTGRALLDTALSSFGEARAEAYVECVRTASAPGNHAVVLGLVSAALGVPRVDAVAGELFAFSAGWVAAAVRLGLTDHRTAQLVLHRVRDTTAAAAADAAARGVDDISACTPQLDVLAMRHEAADVRLFAS